MRGSECSIQQAAVPSSSQPAAAPHLLSRRTIKQPATMQLRKAGYSDGEGSYCPNTSELKQFKKEKLSLDAELLSLDDAPRQSVAEVPRHNRHDLLLRVEVRYFAGTSTEVLGTVEGVDRGEESQEIAVPSKVLRRRSDTLHLRAA